jgi:hypothetical protein
VCKTPHGPSPAALTALLLPLLLLLLLLPLLPLGVQVMQPQLVQQALHR